jgi:hypothetical protein
MSSSYCPVARPSDWYEPESALEWRKAQRPRNNVEGKLALIDEIVSKALVTTRTDSAEVPVEARFRELANEWSSEVSNVSSVGVLTSHPKYQEIVRLGWGVVPFLLADLQQDRGFWFTALNEITGIRPFDPSDAGKTKRMTEAWVNWGKRKGII